MNNVVAYNVERPTGKRDIEVPTTGELSKRLQNRFYSTDDVDNSRLPFVVADFIIPEEWTHRAPPMNDVNPNSFQGVCLEPRPYSAPSSSHVIDQIFLDMSHTAALDEQQLLKAKQLFLPSSVFTGMNMDSDVISYFCIIQEFQRKHSMKGFVNPISLTVQTTDQNRPPLTLSSGPLWPHPSQPPSPTADGFKYLKNQHTFIYKDVTEELWPRDSLSILIILLYLADEPHANAVFVEKTSPAILQVSRFDPNGYGDGWVDNLIRSDIESDESLLEYLATEAFGNGYSLEFKTHNWTFPFGLQLKCEEQSQSRGLCNLHTAQVVDFVIRNQPNGYPKALLYFEAMSPSQILLDAKAFESRVKRIVKHLFRAYLAFSNYRAVILTDPALRDNLVVKETMERYRERIRETYHHQRLDELNSIVRELERQSDHGIIED